MTTLGTVIRAIKDGGEMPPFRNNVLTMALQRHLEGKSFVVMFVNVSTEKGNLEQTINSLNFADNARSCKLSKGPKRTLSLNKWSKWKLKDSWFNLISFLIPSSISIFCIKLNAVLIVRHPTVSIPKAIYHPSHLEKTKREIILANFFIRTSYQK